jgi:uncharacterized protein (DUF1330 family)
MAPWFLILKLNPGSDLEAWSSAIKADRGEVIVKAAATDVKPLEAGSAHNALIIARFAFEADLDQAWVAMASAAQGLVALKSIGLPWEGWPGADLPTIATVQVPDAGAPRVYMLIEGTGFDVERMDRYRDVILPMLRQRGAYYVQFELGAKAQVLAGIWAEGILAISRWPSWAAAEDFWYSERYQTVAIPIRTGFGRFDVQIAEGLAG